LVLWQKDFAHVCASLMAACPLGSAAMGPDAPVVTGLASTARSLKAFAQAVAAEVGVVDQSLHLHRHRRRRLLRQHQLPHRRRLLRPWVQLLAMVC